MCTLLACDSDPLVHVDVKSCAVALRPLCFHRKLPAKLAFVPYALALKYYTVHMIEILEYIHHTQMYVICHGQEEGRKGRGKEVQLCLVR